MSLELMWPYVNNNSNPSVEGFITWAKEQQDPIYKMKYEQVKKLFIINYNRKNY